jgi:hypothetical protein
VTHLHLFVLMLQLLLLLPEVVALLIQLLQVTDATAAALTPFFCVTDATAAAVTPFGSLPTVLMMNTVYVTDHSIFSVVSCRGNPHPPQGVRTPPSTTPACDASAAPVHAS